MTKRMRELLLRMVRDPAGPWGERGEDGRKKQGRTRTLWALRRLGYVEFLHHGEKLTNPKRRGGEEMTGPGFYVTEAGLEVARAQGS